MQRLGAAFNGFTIEASNGKVENVSDILFDDKKLELAVAGRRYRKLARWAEDTASPLSLQKPDFEGRAFEARLTKALVEQSPDIDHNQPISRHIEASLYSY